MTIGRISSERSGERIRNDWKLWNSKIWSWAPGMGSIPRWTDCDDCDCDFSVKGLNCSELNDFHSSHKCLYSTFVECFTFSLSSILFFQIVRNWFSGSMYLLHVDFQCVSWYEITFPSVRYTGELAWMRWTRCSWL